MRHFSVCRTPIHSSVNALLQHYQEHYGTNQISPKKYEFKVKYMKRSVIGKEKEVYFPRKQWERLLNKLDTVRENGCSLTIISMSRTLEKNQWRLKIRYVKEWSFQENPSNNTVEMKPNYLQIVIQ